MISVRALIQQLEAAVQACERDDGPHHRYELELLLAEGLPFWVPVPVRARLEALGLHPGDAPRVPGRALGVVALPEGGAGGRLIWLQVRVSEQVSLSERAGPAVLSPASLDSLRRAAALAIRLYPHPWPLHPARDLEFELLDLSGASLELTEPRGDIDQADRIYGNSLGLAALVATWSCLAGEPVVRPELVFTGEIGWFERAPYAPVLAVGRLEDKAVEVGEAGGCLVTARWCAGGPETIGGLEPAEVADVAATLALAFGPAWHQPQRCRKPPRYDPGVALELLELDYRGGGGGWSAGELALRFEALAGDPQLPPSPRAFAAARAGACYTHLNRLAEAESRLVEALRQLEALPAEEVEGEVLVLLHTHLANVYRDLYDFDRATDAARTAASLAGQWRLQRHALNARSTLGQILAAAGHPEEGLAHLVAARDYYESRHSAECPRNHVYVYDALLRLGRGAEARVERDVCLEHNRARVGPNQQRVNQAFLDYAELRHRQHEARTARAPRPVWEALCAGAEQAVSGLEAPWPRLGLERIRDGAAVWAAETRLEREAVLARVRARLKAQPPGSLLAWHCGLVLLEAAAAAVGGGASSAVGGGGASSAVTGALVREGLEALPGGQARAFFSPWLKDLEQGAGSEACFRALCGLLEAEQY